MKSSWILGLALIPISAAAQIQVLAATYGPNCGATRDNAKAAIASACDGQRRCAYVIDFHVLGDPAPGCAKTFVAEWQCAAGTHQQTEVQAEAGNGSKLVLSCAVFIQGTAIDLAAQAAADAKAADAKRILAATDFNGDGKSDILWRNYRTGDNSIWLMNGATPTNFLTIKKVEDLDWQMVGSGDFNGDGKPDILWRNWRTGENSIWLMNGTTPTDFLTIKKVEDLDWQMVGSGDFNGDGKTDILWRNYRTGENSIWLMNGTTPTDFLTIKKVEDLNWQIAGTDDFNGDGKTDILWRNYRTGENSIWLMDGTTPTAFLTIKTVEDLNWQMAGTGDFNGDGKPDILWRNYRTGENSIWLMNGTTPTDFLTIKKVEDLSWSLPPASPDTDSDGVSDNVENELLARFRPFYRFSKYYDTDEDSRPADALWFVQHSELMDHHSENDTPVFTMEKLAQTPGLILIKTSTPPSLVEDYPKTTRFYINLHNEFRSGEPDWGRIEREATGLYGHVTPLHEDASGLVTGFKIEFWQFYAFNPVPAQNCTTIETGTDLDNLNGAHEGDWEGVELVVEADKKTIRTVRHNIHNTDVVFEVNGAPPTIVLDGGFVEYRSPQTKLSLDLYTFRNSSVKNNNLLRFFCNEDGCTHPVVYIEHGGHASWPTQYWFWPGVLNHDGNSPHAYLVATPPNLGEIGHPNPQCPACALVVGFNGHWGSCGADPPDGPPLKATWGKP